MRSPARGIFFRHVLREVAAHTLIVGAVLLAVLIIYQLAFVLGRAADGQIPGGTVPRLVLLSLRGNLGVILPFAVLLGVVLGLGRLYYDSEVAAAQAGGIGNGQLYAAAGAVALPTALLAAWVAFYDGPAAAREVVALRLEALRTAALRGLAPGTFRPLGEGTTLSFGAVGSTGELQEVFMQRDLPPAADGLPRLQVVLAAQARYDLSAAGDRWRIELLDGRNYEGTPGALDWRITSFRREVIYLPVPEARLPGRPRVDGFDNGALLRGVDDPRLAGELHWRVGWVLAVLVLGLVAAPLARLRPRQGRYSQIPWAVLLFALYAGLLTSGRSLLDRGETPVLLGLWWVHAVALATGWLLLGMPRIAARLRRTSPR